MYVYLGLHIFTISFPLARSFESKVAYARQWKYLLPGMVITAACFLVWDYLFTTSGVWSFNETYVTGIYLAQMPIEEWLFFFTVPFACIFIYACVNYFIPKPRFPVIYRYIALLLAVILLVFAWIFADRAYTFYNFLFTGLFLGFLAWKNDDYLGKFFITFAWVLIPFFVVNGILTGTGIKDQVVWYNPDEIIGWRLGTIPIEDPFYGLLLVGMNVFWFEFFKRKK